MRVLFVCLGNICRSPLAEGLFAEAVAECGLSPQFTIDSAGTAGYHIGELADKRTRANAASHGLELTHRARQFRASDFHDFDLILAMDKSNLQNISRMKPPTATAKAMLLRDFDSVQSHNGEVPDPYYGTSDDFEEVYQIARRATRLLLEHLVAEKQL